MELKTMPHLIEIIFSNRSYIFTSIKQLKPFFTELFSCIVLRRALKGISTYHELEHAHIN